MKRFFKILVVLCLAAELAGCASSMQTIQKKFTRKKKAVSHVPTAIYFEEGAYQKKYSNDYYYKTHYTMFRTWQDDLLDQLGGNDKKVSRCVQESYNHLTEMSQYLVPEKKVELEKEISALKKVMDTIDRGGYSSQEGSLRVEIERIRRAVSNNFYYDKVKDSLLPDTVDLGDSSEDPQTSK